MQLKTHLYIANEIHTRFEEDLNKFFFKLGSVLPDLLPNMRFRSHNSKSRGYVQRKIDKLDNKMNKRRFILSVRLGIISHFLSDFSCKPHMEGYTGSMVDHRKYEVNLSLFHGRYHEDLVKSVVESSDVISRVVERKVALKKAV